MKTFLLSSFWSFIAILLIDGPWLVIMNKLFYSKKLAHLMADQVNLAAAGVFYMLYPIAISLFIVTPALDGEWSFVKTWLYGAMFGLVAYGTYDLTNLATLKGWPLSVTVVDMVWGAILTGVCAVIAVAVMRRFFA